MKILCIDPAGCSLDFALRCQAFGHEVRMWVPNTKRGEYNPVGCGLVTRVPEFESSMRWADLIFCTDNAHFMGRIAPYFKKGFPIFGCNPQAAELELDRQLGQDMLQRYGIETIPGHTFSSYDQAEAFVRKTMKRYVSKPNGDVDKSLSYVSKSPADMVFMLQNWKRRGKSKQPFILQEFVPGVEMAVGGWFGHNGWSQHFLENFEHKKLMNDDYGPNTGESGTVMKYVQESKLADEMLLPLTGMLHDLDYVGYCDVSVIVGKDGTPYPLEFTTRPGWPCFHIQSSLHKGDPAQWMCDLMDGFDTLKVSDKIATGVVLAVPDYPYTTYTKKDVSGVPIYGVTDQNCEHVHPVEVQLGKKVPQMQGNKLIEDDCWVSAGDYLAVVTGLGNTVGDSSDRAYKTVKELEIPNNLIVRTDIGHRLENQLADLHKHGYATEFKY